MSTGDRNSVEKITLYDAINVSENATVEEIQVACESLEAHFSRGASYGSDWSKGWVALAHRARDTLTEHQRRVAYDALIRSTLFEGEEWPASRQKMPKAIYPKFDKEANRKTHLVIAGIVLFIVAAVVVSFRKEGGVDLGRLPEISREIPFELRNAAGRCESLGNPEQLNCAEIQKRYEAELFKRLKGER